MTVRGVSSKKSVRPSQESVKGPKAARFLGFFAIFRVEYDTRRFRVANLSSPRLEVQAGLRTRVFASRVLKAVLADFRPFDDAFGSLAEAGAYSDLDARDKAFARAIAATALRRLGQIEDILMHFIGKPLPENADDARAILTGAAAQLLFMDVAPHAAIGLAVEQAKASRESVRYSGLINAVLRRVSENGAVLTSTQDAALLNTPDWLYERWIRAHGLNVAHAIAAAHAEEPPLDLSCKSDPGVWAERLGGIALANGTIRLKTGGRIEGLEGYEEGAWWVQDAAAALPALLLGDVKGLRVADLCAAPGGKTAQLAARGAKVTAVDISPGRLRRLKQNLGRLHLEANVVEADIGGWTPSGLFPAVLLDAPCSATGTIRRNPDIPYIKSARDLEALTGVQARLLSSAADLVEQGGQLVYCTCSVEPEEGEMQIEHFLAKRTDFALDPVSAQECPLAPEAVTAAGTLRTLPFMVQHGDGLSGLDGFFAVRLRKA